MSGSPTISTVEPVVASLRVQSSVYGATVPLVYGRARMSGNLVWYGGFKAIPHTSVQSSGGKGGGGVTTTDTKFTYQAAVIMALGEGPINNILSGWRGKQHYTATPSNNVPIAEVETITVAAGGVYTVTQAASFLNNVQVTDTRPESYDYGG